MPDIKDLNEIKEKAGEALDQVSKNKEANVIYEKAAGAIEKKANIDVPSAGDLSKMLK